MHSSSPWVKKAHSHVKFMLTVYIDFNGIVRHEVLPDETVKKEYYKFNDIYVKQSKKKKTPEKQAHGICIMIIRLFKFHCLTWLFGKKYNKMSQPSNSFDLTPCDFFLVPKKKENLKDVSEIERKAGNILYNIFLRTFWRQQQQILTNNKVFYLKKLNFNFWLINLYKDSLLTIENWT